MVYIMEFEALQKLYYDLVANHRDTVAKLELVQEELARTRKTCDAAIKERNLVIQDRNGLRQQCTAAIRQWDTALFECTKAKEQLTKVQQQRDEAMKEINQAMAVRIKLTKDLARLTEERNAAVQEYSLIMSERDSVHKEIEKLQEELTETQKKVKSLQEEKKISIVDMEGLRKELTTALMDRDKVIKELNDVYDKYSDYVSGNSEDLSPFSPLKPTGTNFNLWGSSSSGVSFSWAQLVSKSTNSDLLKQNHLSASNSSTVSTANHHKGSSSKMENLDQANIEIEALRHLLARLQNELLELEQERSWAFTERDKIVMERESINKYCNRLWKERNRAVSELAEVLRDSDDIKRQKHETLKELQELKEQMAAQKKDPVYESSEKATINKERFVSRCTQTEDQNRLSYPLTHPPSSSGLFHSLSRRSGKKVKSLILAHSDISILSSPSPSSSTSPPHEPTPQEPNQTLPTPTLLDRAYNKIFGNGVPLDGLSTFPKRSQRIRIPSNSGVPSKSSGTRLSSSSIDKTPTLSLIDRNSPLIWSYKVEWVNRPRRSTNSEDMTPKPGDIRNIIFAKTSEPLGMNINSAAGSIFVSIVNENSLASQAGLQVGDQLLEVCGINVRNTTYDMAVKVLRNCSGSDSIAMLVQYNPDKCKETSFETLTNTTDEDDGDDEDEDEPESRVFLSKKKSSNSIIKKVKTMESLLLSFGKFESAC